MALSEEQKADDVRRLTRFGLDHTNSCPMDALLNVIRDYQRLRAAEKRILEILEHAHDGGALYPIRMALEGKADAATGEGPA